MTGALYFVMAKDHSILAVFDNISDAREKLHGSFSAQYVAREDGVVVAYMSREGQSWKPITRVPPEARPALKEHIERRSTATVASDL